MHNHVEWLLRPMNPADQTVVGQVLGEAFADIYTPAVGDDPQLIAAIAGIFPNDLACHVGEHDGQICGVGLLSFSALHGEIGFQEERRIWHLLRERQSFIHALRSRLLLSLPASSNRADRFTGYISSLAVRPLWQGQGLGSALLKSLEDTARRAGKTRVALHVTDTNWRARQLYERHGFRAQGVERTVFTYRIWGFRALVYMIKPLSNIHNK